MNRLFLLTVAVLSGLAMCVGADTASAQIFRRRVPMTQPAQATQPTQGPQLGAQNDTFLVDWLGADNQVEITLSQFGSERVSNQEVKNFSQEMIRAHTELANKLNQTLTNSRAAASARNGQIRYTAGYRGPDGAVQPGKTEQPAATAQQQPVTGQQQPAAAQQQPVTGQQQPAAAQQQPAAGQQQPVVQQQSANIAGTDPNLNALNFKREINDQLVKAIEEKLGQEKGPNFDRCYMQGQIVGHTHMLATLEVARNQASPQLKPVVDEAIATAQKHLSQAESLMSKLEPQQSH